MLVSSALGGQPTLRARSCPERSGAPCGPACRGGSQQRQLFGADRGHRGQRRRRAEGVSICLRLSLSRSLSLSSFSLSLSLSFSLSLSLSIAVSLSISLSLSLSPRNPLKPAPPLRERDPKPLNPKSVRDGAGSFGAVRRGGCGLVPLLRGVAASVLVYVPKIARHPYKRTLRGSLV